MDSDIIKAVLVLVGLASFLGLVLGYASVRFKVEGDPITDQIDSLLPQTQCGQCSYAGCRPYAEAIASGEIGINQCPPGGEATIQALADLLDVDVEPLDAERGEHKDVATVAVIIEDTCIGCTLCIQACPVDAIVGSAKHMHTVIASECTGCDLCLPPCPVDCIVMEPVKSTPASWKWPEPSHPASALQAMAVVVEEKEGASS
ncbi:MAG TPA: electron transport complex subunit RsxB [Leucothrix mucor]|nr:electron transport complex subunit RsxB [Leucothrix mucor]